jgi:hypothetical protein
MTKAHIVEIDRLVLRGLDITPERAEQIRALLEMEMGRQLEGGLAEDLAGGERLDATPVRLGESQSDGQLAAGVAKSIVQALRNGRR